MTAPSHLTRVNVDNYVHAATSRHFANTARMAKGVNRFAHGRRPTPLDKQRIMRMNRDTIYSSAIIDINGGASVTLPDAGARYLSLAVINEDNYTTAIHHGAGTYELTTDEHETAFVMVVARILGDWNDPADLAAANELQDQLQIKSASSLPYVQPVYDPETFDATHDLLKQLAGGLTEASRCSGRRDEVSETRHMLMAAFGWGGLPEYEVVYEASTTELPIADQQLTVHDAPVNGFWSISIYNRDGYFEQNPYESYSLNSEIADANADGSFTLNFGQQPNDRPNFLYVMDGWSYNVRLYQPRREILDGEWKFPVPQLVS